jgi:hypothetical protein
MYQVLASLALASNDHFTTLLLPAAITIDPGRVLEDLTRIGTTCITTDPVLSNIPGLVFDHTAALTRSSGIARRITRAGLLSPDD